MAIMNTNEIRFKNNATKVKSIVFIEKYVEKWTIILKPKQKKANRDSKRISLLER
jgi:hypothetical protein